MTARERFLRACRKQAVDRPPIWFMRQAGRYMPEYRALRREYSILEICKRPDLAAQVTATAVERLNVDAAIIFADLLLPAEPLGLELRYAAGEGPIVTPPVRDREAVAKLDGELRGRLGYVAEAIRRAQSALGSEMPIIGFAGAPFTLASYLIEGGASRDFRHTKAMLHGDPVAWSHLMEKLSPMIVEYLSEQVQAGAAAIQLFDSWAGALSEADYRRFALPFNQLIVGAVQDLGVPVIYFSTGTGGYLESVAATGAAVIGLDWRVSLGAAWRRLDYQPAVQGNLDPALLLAPLAELRSAARLILNEAGDRPGHIFNLGHGIWPETPVENVQALVAMIRNGAAQPQAEAGAATQPASAAPRARQRRVRK
ncbi:MAG TPA: uroporphyrinogen decarboxylase [Terriglobales bacterium]|nr:uroporphyrinogen decarboxylase [Terriglobales bacterium]